MEEMNYPVEHICIYSMDDNKKYKIPLPDEDPKMKAGFFSLLENMRAFQLSNPFTINPGKCDRCIYRNLCDIP